MLNTNHSNVHSGKLPLWAFVVFGIILLVAVGSTWLLAKKSFDQHVINDKVFSQLDSSIVAINHSLIQDNKNEYDKMQARLKKPELRENLSLWKPRLDGVLRIGFTMHQFLERTKQEMFMHSHDANSNKNDFKRVADSLLSFKDQLIHLLPENRRSQLSFLPIETEPANIISNHFYRDLSNSARMAMLSKIEFSSLQSVNQVVQIINQQSTYQDLEFDQFDVLIGQNSMYFLPGQTLEVSAGLGAYSTAAKPIVIIDEKVIPTNEYGVAVYKKLVSAKDSSGKIDVSVSFKDPQTGLTKTKEMMIGYKVFQLKD